MDHRNRKGASHRHVSDRDRLWLRATQWEGRWQPRRLSARRI